MKLWKEIIASDKSYTEALEHIESNPSTSYITRPEWEGVHFIANGKRYCILLKTGEVLLDKVKVYNMDKMDWLIVTLTDESIKILKDKELI